MIKTILFDLDGTLLPMDMERFTKKYFELLSARLSKYGYESKELVANIWGGTKAMVKNSGIVTNEVAFWNYFCEKYGSQSISAKSVVDNFYSEEFEEAKSECGFNPKAPELIGYIKSLGYRTILATNPIFPGVATRKRINWAGLAPDDFEYYTTYENSHFCKPNIKYYEELAEKADILPNDCLMVGNDTDEDMIAEKTGMKVFLLTDCLINKSGVNIEKYPHGGFDELKKYIDGLGSL